MNRKRFKAEEIVNKLREADCLELSCTATCYARPAADDGAGGCWSNRRDGIMNRAGQT